MTRRWSRELASEQPVVRSPRARILAERAAKKRNPRLVSQLTTLSRPAIKPWRVHRDERVPPLEALWTLYVVGGFDESAAQRLLNHADPHVRSWTVRLIGDEETLSASLAKSARTAGPRRAERNRAPAIGLHGQALCPRTRDAVAVQLPRTCRGCLDDPYLPLCLVGVENFATTARDSVLTTLTPRSAWQSPLVRDFMLPRLMQRYAAEQCNDGARRRARRSCSPRRPRGPGLAVGSVGRSVARPSVDRRGIGLAHPTSNRRLASRPRQCDAFAPHRCVSDTPSARDYVANTSAGCSRGRAFAWPLLGILAEIGTSEDIAKLRSAPRIQPARRLCNQPHYGRFARGSDPQLADAILAAYPTVVAALCAARRVTCSWPSVSGRGCSWIGLPKARSNRRRSHFDQLRVVAAHDDRRIRCPGAKFWGAIHQATPEERLAVVRRLNNDLRAAAGHAEAGREIFRRAMRHVPYPVR